MTTTARRRLLALAVLVTLAVLVLDLVGSALPGGARSGAAVALGPVQRVLAGGDHADTTRLAEENAVLRAQLAEALARLEDDAVTGRVLASSAAASGRLVAGRVVGQQVTPTGGRHVTIDVGSRDGIEPNLTVVAAEGLVGRVVTVGPDTSDIRLVDGADAAVAVRVGSGGLGSVRAAPGGGGADRGRGDLVLTLLDHTPLAVGDRVTTLGSVGGRPYVAGVVVGTVTALDPPRGQQPVTAVVHPAVDTTRLDVLAVVLRAGAGGAAGAAS